MATIPKVGDTLHFVMEPGQHCPGMVMVQAEAAHGAVGLFVFNTDANHFEQTVNRDAFSCSLLKRERVPWAKASEDKAGTWHWPEGRPKPKDAAEEDGA